MWQRPAVSTRVRKAAGCAGSIAFCLLAVCSGGGGGDGTGGGTEGDIDVVLEPAFGGRTFSAAVKLVQHPTEDDRWYVVEQAGTVQTFRDGQPLATDLEAVDVGPGGVGINLSPDDEQGLLGLAFDPDFDDVNGGELYLSYTDEGGAGTADDFSVVARYESTDGGQSFAPVMDPIVLAIPHPANNHNGGDLAFGVLDDFLYYSMGDGGGSNDPDDNGQDTTTLLGSLIRLDVRSMPPMAQAYAIPAGNPFAGNALCDSGGSPTPAGCPEIFAYGLRNPYRIGFDSLTGDLWLGDVGQGAREEVDLVVAGGNYGWDCREGDIAHATAVACGGAGAYIEPEAVYDNPGGPGTPRSVIGGLVYRGAAIPDLEGYYLYADFYTGEIFALDTGSMDPPELLIDTAFNVSSFAEDRDGEVYVTTQSLVGASTLIYRLEPAPAP